MNTYITYGIIFVGLLVLELIYFKVADKFNIIDKPSERSSHTAVVLRGGGILFPIAVLVWLVTDAINGMNVIVYLPFVTGLVLISGVSFLDDIVSLSNSVRLLIHFASYCLMFWSLGVFGLYDEYGRLMAVGVTLLALVVCVGATNVYNFMDGVNGIMAGYSLAVIIPLLLLNQEMAFVEQSLLVVTAIAIMVFSIFNFRRKGREKCFAGDVGSVGIAYILLFAICRLILQKGDITWLIFMLVYGVDGCLTICHRIMLHENLGEAHRKHAYQLMTNELKMEHPVVSGVYMVLQLAVSLGFVYLCPSTVRAHWIYLAGAFGVCGCMYLLFMKKYYHLHKEYLASLKE